VTPDGKSVLVTNHDDSTLQVFDSKTLTLRATIPIAAGPAQIAILPDSSTAFVSATTANQVSVVDLRRNALLSNLPLPGKPAALLLKPDGGELYVTVPEAHELAIINTWTHQLADSILLGSTPRDGVISPDGTTIYISDSAADRVLAVDSAYRTLRSAGPGAGSAGMPPNVGAQPGMCALAPSGDLLLAVDEGSNDLAVIRIRGQDMVLITLIPVGNAPRDLAIKLY
jgi:YVTN family beta-propeller protein